VERKDAREKVQQQRSQRREFEDELAQLTEEKDELARRSLTYTKAQNCAEAVKRVNNYDRILPFLEDLVNDFSAAYKMHLHLEKSECSHGGAPGRSCRAKGPEAGGGRGGSSFSGTMSTFILRS
jgi:hypothetical protein